jgi:hypothetical protein
LRRLRETGCPILTIRSRGFRGLQSSPGAPRTPIGLRSPLPSLRFPRTLGSSNLRAAEPVPQSNAPLLSFDATLSVFPLRSRPDPRPSVDISDGPQTPRLSSPALQHFRKNGPFLPLSRASANRATIPRSPTLRVWLPSRRCQLHSPSEASLSSQHSGASPFRAFLHIGNQDHVSTTSLRSRAFLPNLSA